jgi:tight adherence protein C
MTTGVVLGCLFGAAVCLLIYALVPPRPRLATSVRRWERQRAQRAVGGQIGAGGFDLESQQRRLGRWLVTQLTRRGITMAKLRGNLELTETSLEAHMVRKCGYGLFGLLFPTIVVTLLYATAGITLGFTVPAVAGIVFGAILFWLPDLSAAQAAEERRHDLRRALACYLDLVSMSLAGGRGIPEALPTCARIGSGWAFELIRDTIDEARYVGATPWRALGELGERTGLQELADLGSALTLVADDGSKVQASLSARAATQRRRQLAEDEGSAGKSDQTIQLAQVVLAIGFFIFIGFPALYAVLAI